MTTGCNDVYLRQGHGRAPVSLPDAETLREADKALKARDVVVRDPVRCYDSGYDIGSFLDSEGNTFWFCGPAKEQARRAGRVPEGARENCFDKGLGIMSSEFRVRNPSARRPPQDSDLHRRTVQRRGGPGRWNGCRRPRTGTKHCH